MTIQITLFCPGCQSDNVVKNGHKSYLNKQNYLCKDCQRQFIGDHNLSYLGCHSALDQRLRRMFVRGMGIRDIAEVEQISIGKVLYSLVKLKLTPQAKESHRDFYGSNKGSDINFFIFSIISDASKYSVDNFVTYRVYHEHFVLSLLYFSVVVVSHFSLPRDYGQRGHMQ